jgi:hypothetical protein
MCLRVCSYLSFFVRSYRRLLMWLPHGTAADVTTEALKAQMYLCKYDDPYKWKTPCKQVSAGLFPD